MSRDGRRDRRTGLLVIANWRDLDHPEAGGAELVCQELAARFAERGENVVVLAASVAGRPRHERRDGYRIVRGGGRFTVYAHALAWLLRHHGEVGAVIDSQNGIPFFTPLAVASRTPVVMLLHHVHQDQFGAYFSAPVAALGRWLESSASRRVYGRRAVVAVSPSTRTDARRRLGLRGSLWVAPPGLAVDSARGVARSEHPSVVSVGRLVPHKQVNQVISALPAVLERHPALTVTFIGRGPEREGLLRLAEDLGVAHAVDIRGDLDDEARDRALAGAWMSVNASEGEGWGLSVVEANAQGVPVLAFRRRGLRDSIVDGETGWLIDEGGDLAAALADRLDELDDARTAAQYARRARDWAATFTWEAMADRILLALDVEEDRLNASGEGARTLSDAATVLTLPTEVLPAGWTQRLRRSDLWIRDGDDVRILCLDTDVVAAEQLVQSLGLAIGSPQRARVTIEVARTRDYLSLKRADVRNALADQ
ncbi:glycosyltransferase [Rathayibacter festucae]|uniref:D-inositol 3-phosphate glycosyltransferase n=1 Tax=Rathayibacter festucae TaxID=110937 RepID=A0ABX6H3S9_9MICO|nr:MULTISPECIES: glycosyltransferase family 4 protein [Rathayibacter]QHC64470.1 glycosyltransferase [Rathayibacter festucae]ROQ64761.1 glycosyltransferase involved in cell wall biosynthesis [Rathayibacter sp. PhB152]